MTDQCFKLTVLKSFLWVTVRLVRFSPPATIKGLITTSSNFIKSVRLKKLFRIRRKKIFWVLDKSPLVRVPTLLENMFREFECNFTFQSKIMFFYFRFYMRFKNTFLVTDYFKSNADFFLKKARYDKYNYMYINYFKKNWKQLFNSNSVDTVNGIFVNTPKQQLFMTLFKKRLLVTISAGFIRILVKFEKKCYKKRKVVILNTIRLFLKMIYLAKLVRPSFVRLTRSLPILPVLLSEFKQSNYIKQIDYFLFEPKLSFGTLNRQKKSSIKKKIRKNKLPRIEQV